MSVKFPHAIKSSFGTYVQWTQLKYSMALKLVKPGQFYSLEMVTRLYTCHFPTTEQQWYSMLTESPPVDCPVFWCMLSGGQVFIIQCSPQYNNHPYLTRYGKGQVWGVYFNTKCPLILSHCLSLLWIICIWTGTLKLQHIIPWCFPLIAIRFQYGRGYVRSHSTSERFAIVVPPPT